MFLSLSFFFFFVVVVVVVVAFLHFSLSFHSIISAELNMCAATTRLCSLQCDVKINYVRPEVFYKTDG